MADLPHNGLIARLLQSSIGEIFYGDHAPLWRQGRNNSPPATRRDAQAQRRRDVKTLRRWGKQNNRALRLADKLETCRSSDRCASGACSECGRARQRLFVDAAEKLLRNFANNVKVVSVVFRGAWVREGELGDDSRLFEALSRRLGRALRAAGVKAAFGGFDISANEHAEDLFAPHYRPHAWLFVSAREFERGEKTFRKFFPTSAKVARPVVARDFDGRNRGLAYALKTEFARRVTLPRLTTPNGSVRRRNTRDRPLRAQQKVELALALHRQGLGARLFLHGLKLLETPEGLRFSAYGRARPAARHRRQLQDASAATKHVSESVKAQPSPAKHPQERTARGPV